MNNSAQQLHQRLQKMMVPVTHPSMEGLETGSVFMPGSMQPCTLFDIIKLSNDILAYLLFEADPSSPDPLLTVAMAKIYFVNHVRQGVFPGTVIERAHNDIVKHLGYNPGFSVFVGYLDLNDHRLTYCTTGSVAPLLLRKASGTIEFHAVSSPGFGMPGEVVFEEQYAHLEQGDCLMLHTQGLNRLFTGDTIKHPAQTFLQHIFTSAEPIVLRTELEKQIALRCKGTPPVTDIALLYAEVLTQSRKNQLKEKLGFRESDKVHLHFFSYLEEMDRATAHILSALDMAGFQDEDIRKMKIILTELLVNAVVHGNRKDPTKRVVVGHLIDKHRAIVSVMDEGEGFTPSDIPDPTLPENLEKPCGRGLFIVRHYVESISHNETGSRVTIVKNNQPSLR